MTAARGFGLIGFFFAIGSAASFGLSGIFASALMTAGWTPGAAATTRIILAALVLLIPTLIALRGSWDQVRAAWKSVVLFGILGIVVPQLCFFIAVQYIAPSLALLIEFLGPVLLVFYLWLRTRIAPSWLTLTGAALALLGLLAISGIAVGASLHPVGVLFGLLAAVGLAGYFVLAANANHGIAPLPFTGLGLGVAALILFVASASGLLPFVATFDTTILAGAEVPAWVTVAAMVLISTVLAYVLGVMAARRLGATVASFTAYSESLFGIFWTILLLGILPTGMQWLGAALIIGGVVVVKLGELSASRRRSASDRTAAGRIL